MENPITVEVTVDAPQDKVWEMFTRPEHIKKWSNASDDWHTPEAENDLRVGGKFNSRMESKDGSEGFNFTGVYTEITPMEYISYAMDDGRKVDVKFEIAEDGIHITENFEPETINLPEMQKIGWQAILNNFKKYVENN